MRHTLVKFLATMTLHIENILVSTFELRYGMKLKYKM